MCTKVVLCHALQLVAAKLPRVISPYDVTGFRRLARIVSVLSMHPVACHYLAADTFWHNGHCITVFGSGHFLAHWIILKIGGEVKGTVMHYINKINSQGPLYGTRSISVCQLTTINIMFLIVCVHSLCVFLCLLNETALRFVYHSCVYGTERSRCSV